MLLNLSNHPSSKWPFDQIMAANIQFDGVEDLPFPNIDPFADDFEVARLSGDYFKMITARPDVSELTVHLMGEMTFSFRLINRLKKAGIPVVASTTNRTVLEEKDGKKTIQFQFIQFRNY
jgi:hypothetical protein